CSFQIASSITLFIGRNVDKFLWGWNIPTVAFSSLDPLFVVLTAPFFTWLWHYLSTIKKEPSPAIKLALGLALAGIAFVILSIISLHTQNHRILVLWMIVLVNLCLGAG
ncbi:MAG: MFS transporter, partial [Gammaproteobacteria bacterium]